MPCSSWHYDSSEFSRTTVTDNDWVCDDGHRVTDAFFAGTVGAIVGTIVFNNLSDIIGRRFDPSYSVQASL